MAKQLVPDTAQFRLIQRLASGSEPTVDFMNVFYVRNLISAWTTAHLQATAEDIRDAWIGGMGSQQTADVSYVEVQAEDLGADPGNQVVVDAEGVGGAIEQTVPLSVCALVKLRGSSDAEPRTGRIYISGLPESATNGNLLEAAYVAATQSDIRSFYTTGLQAGDAFVIVSRYDEQYRDPDTNPKGRRPVGVVNVIQGALCEVRPLVGSQRDRRT